MFYRVCLAVPSARINGLTDALDAHLIHAAVSSGDLVEGAQRTPLGSTAVEVLFDAPPALDKLRLVLASAGIAPDLDLEVEPLAHRDWVRESLRSLNAVRAGRFYIAGRHIDRALSDQGVRLSIDAGLAFGTGHHETTCGCLMQLDRLLRACKPRTMLDVGTGTGVLALAVLKVYPSVRATASDIDHVATLTARENFAINGVRARVLTAPGVQNQRIASDAPYDLITANILARPIIALAPSLSKLLAPGGSLVLAGLLNEQARAVMSAYRSHGVYLKNTLRLGVWTILHLVRPR